MSRPEQTRPRPGLPPVGDDVLQLIDLALAEDRGAGDWTSRWIVPPRTRIRARITAGQDGIIAGLTPALAVFMRVDGRIETNLLSRDGEHVAAGDAVCEVRGPGRAILTAERVALNFLGRLSGVATLTRRFVDAIDGTGVRILDTRKTTPGWRTLEKAAVLAGGGTNHRRGLYDAVMIKDNHIAVAGGIGPAIARVQEQNTRRLHVTVEVGTLDDLAIALDARVDRVLLDNMDTDTMREAVRRIRRHPHPPEIEASGNMSLDRVREVAECGVDFISVGALTHSAKSLDVSMEVIR